MYFCIFCSFWFVYPHSVLNPVEGSVGLVFCYFNVFNFKCPCVLFLSPVFSFPRCIGGSHRQCFEAHRGPAGLTLAFSEMRSCLMGGGSGPIGMQRWSRLYWVLKFHKIGDGGRFLGVDNQGLFMSNTLGWNLYSYASKWWEMLYVCTMYIVHDVTFVNEAEVQGQTRHFKQVQ